MTNKAIQKNSIYKKFILEWIVFIVISLFIFFSGRLYIYQQISSSINDEYKNKIPFCFLTGLRFDIKITATVLSVFVLFFIMGLFVKKIQDFLYKIQRFFLVAILIIFFLLTVSNVFYYQIYGHQFDVFVFGLIDEDTKAVLGTIWKDIPIIKILFSILLFSIITIFLFNKLHGKYQNQIDKKSNIIVKIVYSLTIIAILIIAIRGSFGTFPLRATDIHITQSNTLNSIVSNAVYSLKLAVKEYKNSSHFYTVTQEDGIKLFSSITGKNKNTAQFEELLYQTKKSELLEQNPPNVVFALMESFGTHFLLLDDEKNRDLLGELRSHFVNDFLYLKFISEGDGTSDTIHRFFIRSPLDNISQSKIKNKSFPTNMFQPYKDAGYKIIFITAGNGGWRNLEEFSKHLGVDEFYDENFLKQHYPQSSSLSGTWGVPDEFMFLFAQEKINSAQQPVFVFLLSMTNHPPYQLPKNSERQFFNLSNKEMDRFKNLGSRKEINEVMNTYHYANNSLGKFITQIKKDNKTIIAATGDHNMRGIGYLDEKEIVLGHAVPFYLYIPEIYRNNANAVYDKNRVGSHKDIMPTLYENSLSEIKYIRTGCNLTNVEMNHNEWCRYGYNTEVIITENGAFNLYKKTYSQWQDETQLTMTNESTDIPDTEKNIIARATQYTPFLQYIINKIATE